MPKLKSLEDFLMSELKDLYSAEKQILKALPKMLKKAASQELKNALQNHLTETENQVVRLDEISEILDKSLSGKKCKAMQGLVEEGKEVMAENMSPEVLDVAIICASQKIEHYEIASYGCALTYATLLGLDKVEELLNETLEEEKGDDEKLSAIASELNLEAITGTEKAKENI